MGTKQIKEVRALLINARKTHEKDKRLQNSAFLMLDTMINRPLKDVPVKIKKSSNLKEVVCRYIELNEGDINIIMGEIQDAAFLFPAREDM